jgi:hypothetical protein
MKNTIRRCAFVGSLSLALAGCVDPPGPATSSITEGPSPYMRGGLGSLTYRAVDLMLASAPSVTTDTPLIVASISDAQHLETSSALGNIVSDMIRTVSCRMATLPLNSDCAVRSISIEARASFFSHETGTRLCPLPVLPLS